MDYFRDPGYEYPDLEPQICSSKYKRNGNDETENGDDDDDEDYDDFQSDSKSRLKTNARNTELNSKFNVETGTRSIIQSGR